MFQIVAIFYFFFVQILLFENNKMAKKTDQKTTQTRKNTVESPKSAQFFSAESSRLTDFSTPFITCGLRLTKFKSMTGLL